MPASLAAAMLLMTAGLQLGAVLYLAASGSRFSVAWRLAAITTACAVVVASASHFGGAVTVLSAAGIAVCIGAAVPHMHRFTVVGRLVMIAQALFFGAFVVWGAQYVLSLPVAGVTRALMLASAPLALVAVPVWLVRTFEDWESLCRRSWRRPRSPLPAAGRHALQPRVSIHVPAHAEPPDVVISTLDHLARLDYPDFEVIVIDNNTEDPALWQPVQAHCTRLGERFRFHHVEGLTGAKAGALNLALDLTDPTAELVAVVDADYHANPRFLADLVPFFNDEQMGFVQTPHAYRDWEHSRFLRMCNWEYAYFFNTGMVSLNERNAAITVGTMCVIRWTALEDAGRWAEWCLTEDSELAVRIHALGYESVYLDTVYGRGLIPTTFAGFRKQRFRWTYGPVQELQRHWRLLIPGRRRTPSRLTVAQRIHHATHGLYGLVLLAAAATIPLMGAVIASLHWHGESPPLPFELCAAATSGLTTTYLHRHLVYRNLGARFGEFIGATVAGMALTVVITLASATAFLRRPVPWQRTSKFTQPRTGLRALTTVRTELCVAFGLIVAAVVAALFGSQTGLSGMLVVGLFLHAVIVLAAPFVTVTAERDLSRKAAPLTSRVGPQITPVPVNVPGCSQASEYGVVGRKNVAAGDPVAHASPPRSART